MAIGKNKRLTKCVAASEATAREWSEGLIAAPSELRGGAER